MGELFTVTLCGDGATPPITAANASGPAGDRLSVGQALAPVPHTDAMAPLMPRMVSSPRKVNPAPVGVYVALLAEAIRGVDGNASGTAAGKPANATSDENVTPPAAAKVHPLKDTVSLPLPTTTVAVGRAV